MKKSAIAFLIVLAALLIFVVSVLFYMVSVKNQAVALREQYNAKEKTVQTAHDDMWKTIQQKFDVSDEYKQGFIASVQAVVGGRQGGALFKSVQENMPGLSPDLYREVMATIEGKRDMLKREMDTEVDIARQYNTLVQTFPASLFLDGTKIDPKIITSGRTNDAWNSGQDNDVALREKPQQPKRPAKAQAATN